MKILFVSHNASRTGAPILLLDLCRWIREKTNIVFHFILLEDGPLLDEFTALSETFVVNKNEKNKYKWILKKITRNSYREKKVRKIIRKGKYDLIYVNTIAGMRLFNSLNKIPLPPVILHAHELSISIKQMCDEQAFIGNLHRINLVVAASNAVKLILNRNYSISENILSTIYEPINYELLLKKKRDLTLSLKKTLDLPEKAFIVGGSGTRDWRKGIDIFIQTAARINHDDIYFVWIGGRNKGIEYLKLCYDIERLGLTKKLFLIDSIANPISIYNQFDVFYLSSREDPFPLVCLENAVCGNPVICFENSGGMPEFVSCGAGKSIPYADIDGACTAILNYHKNPDKLRTDGLRASELAKEYDINQFIKWLNMAVKEKLNLSLLN